MTMMDNDNNTVGTVKSSNIQWSTTLVPKPCQLKKEHFSVKEKRDKKKDSKSKGKPDKKSTAVMSRLREKIGELEEDKESEDEEDPSEDEDEDEEEVGKKGSTKAP